eukprot:gene9107-gene1209
MVDYRNSKIYKIVCNVTNLVYVGSTTTPRLCQRLRKHKYNFTRYQQGIGKYYTSYEVLENNNYQIILIEGLPDCQNVEQLRSRERYWIDQMDCVNKNRPYITPEEKRNYQIDWVEKVKEEVPNYRSIVNEKHRLKHSQRELCACGGFYKKYSKWQHQQSQKHKN